jgi:hypothetical protein
VIKSFLFGFILFDFLSLNELLNFFNFLFDLVCFKMNFLLHHFELIKIYNFLLSV